MSNAIRIAVRRRFNEQLKALLGFSRSRRFQHITNQFSRKGKQKLIEVWEKKIFGFFYEFDHEIRTHQSAERETQEKKPPAKHLDIQ